MQEWFLGLHLFVSPLFWCELCLRITKVSVLELDILQASFLTMQLYSRYGNLKLILIFIYIASILYFALAIIFRWWHLFLLKSFIRPSIQVTHMVTLWHSEFEMHFVFNHNHFHIFYFALISSLFSCWLQDTWTKSWARSCKERNRIHWGMYCCVACCYFLRYTT